MSVFLRFLLVSLLIIYALRAILRLLLPVLFQRVVNKAQQSQQNHTRSNHQNPTGRIKIDYIPEEAIKSKVPDTEGDFVDYEEVKSK